MDEKTLQELFDRQGETIAVLAVRITALEEILLEKKVLTKEELGNKAIKLSKEFIAKTQEAFKKKAQEEINQNRVKK